MNVNPSTLAKLSLVTLAVWVFAPLAKAGRSGAYLPVTGPASLRFENAAARNFDFAKFKAALNTAKTNATTEVAKAAIPAEATNNVSMAAETSLNTTPASTVPESIGESVAPTVQRASEAASDMLMVTPQMLIEYLRPSPGATNSNVSVLVPFNFRPPIEQEHRSSQATYKTE